MNQFAAGCDVMTEHQNPNSTPGAVLFMLVTTVCAPASFLLCQAYVTSRVPYSPAMYPPCWSLLTNQRCSGSVRAQALQAQRSELNSRVQALEAVGAELEAQCAQLQVHAHTASTQFHFSHPSDEMSKPMFLTKPETNQVSKIWESLKIHTYLRIHSSLQDSWLSLCG